MRRTPLARALALMLACACSEPEEPEPEVPAIAWCEEVSDWDADAAAFEREVLEQINERRAEGANCENGGEFGPADPLRMDPALRCAARKHVVDMIARDYFDHASPDGDTYVERATQAEYDGAALAESIAAGQHDPEQVVATWMSNDGNCANLMNPDADELGVGYMVATDVMYSEYWTLVFGKGAS